MLTVFFVFNRAVPEQELESISFLIYYNGSDTNNSVSGGVKGVVSLGGLEKQGCFS